MLQPNDWNPTIFSPLAKSHARRISRVTGGLGRLAGFCSGLSDLLASCADACQCAFRASRTCSSDSSSCCSAPMFIYLVR